MRKLGTLGFVFGALLSACGDSSGEDTGAGGNTTSVNGTGAGAGGGTSGVGGMPPVFGKSCTPVNAEPTFAAKGPLLEDAALSELFTALEAFSQSRSHGADAQSDAEIVYDFARTAPHVSEAGVGHDCAVWMRLTDGTPVTIFRDREGFAPGDPDPLADLAGPEPPPPPSVPGKKREPIYPIGGSPAYALPGSVSAFLGQSDNLAGTTLTSIEQALKKRGYKPAAPDTSVTVSDLMTQVKDLGVLYLSTHGMTCSDDQYAKLAYCLSTDVQFNPAPNAGGWACMGSQVECQAALDERKLGRTGLAVQEINQKMQGWYTVNTSFVQQHWTFANDALVFIDACDVMDEMTVMHGVLQGAPLFRASLFQKNVGAILGWEDQVSKGFAAQTAALVFDRILGANALKIPTPKQRPFSAGEVYTWLGSQGAIVDPSGPATLQLRQNANKDVILAPSIRNLVVGDPSDTMKSPEQPGASTELTLYGEFGERTVTVKVGGTVVPVSATKSDSKKLVVTLPGPLSVGSVEVEVATGTDTLKGNAVPLTSWRGACRWKTTYSGTFGAPGIFNELNCSNLHLRGDAHRFRMRPGEAASPGYATEGETLSPEIVFKSSVSDTVCEGSVGGTSMGMGYQIVYQPATLQLPWMPNETSAYPDPPTSYFVVDGKIDASNPDALKFTVWPVTRLHSDADFIFPPPAMSQHVDDFATTVSGFGYLGHWIPIDGTTYAFQQAPTTIALMGGDMGEIQCYMDAEGGTIPVADTEG